MGLSENVQLAIVTALSVAIPAVLAQILIHIRQSNKLKETKEEVIQAKGKVEETRAEVVKATVKLEEIHIQTNSNFKEQKEELKEQKVEIKDLNKHIQTLVKEKAEAESKVEEQNPTKTP